MHSLLMRRGIDVGAKSEIYTLMNELVKQGKFSEELKLVIYRSPESERLEKLLEKYHGNRNAVAAELGISTTTLWRRMKKYGIEPNYVN